MRGVPQDVLSTTLVAHLGMGDMGRFAQVCSTARGAVSKHLGLCERSRRILARRARALGDAGLACVFAVDHGLLDLLAWALPRSREHVSQADLCIRAARVGRADVLAALLRGLRRRLPMRARATIELEAASSGNIEMLELLHPRGRPVRLSTELVRMELVDLRPASELVLPLAALGGHLAAACWLHGRGGCELGELAIAMAARANRLDIVGWLLSHGCRVSTMACAMAALGGHLDLLQRLVLRCGAPMDASAAAYAAEAGHARIYDWVVSSGCQVDGQAMALAARSGDLAMLGWLRLRGAPMDAEAIVEAATHAHARVIDFVHHTLGCAIAASTALLASYVAVEHGSVRVLEWLMRHSGLRLSRRHLACAAFGGGRASERNIEVAEWLLAHGIRPRACPYALIIAVRCGDLAMARWLHAHGAPLSRRVCAEAVARANIDALRWLRDEGLSVRGVSSCDHLGRARPTTRPNPWFGLRPAALRHFAPPAPLVVRADDD